MKSPESSVTDPTASLEDTLAPEGSTVMLARGQPLGKGTALGRYIILRQLGAGAMGAVYEAFDPELERKVALKLMQGGASSSTGLSEGSARMLREARAMAKLVHPNVITVFDVGTVDGRVFLAMELIDGMTLSDWIAQPGHTLHEIVEVFCHAGRGLAAAHAAGVIHRDFKPDNVLVGNDRRVVVLDFGLATPAGARSTPPTPGTGSSKDKEDAEGIVSDSWGSELTATGAIMGTPAYMAPEQHNGRELDARADQFAFCVSMYEALCGQRPFEGDSLPALATNVISGNVRPVPAGARMPRWMASIVLRGLAVRPEDRWPSMEVLVDELSRDPLRRRRRLTMAGIVLVAGAGALGGRWMIEERRIAACRANEREFAGVWDDATRERARTAFEGAAGDYGSESFDRLDETLTRYRETWLDTHAEACTERPPHAALQHLCLDEARAHVAALTGLFDEPTWETIDASVQIVASLPEVEACAAQDELLQRFPVPPDGQEQATVAEVRRSLARVDALSKAGPVKDLIETTEEALARAREIGYEPLVAEALLSHAGELVENARLDEAETSYWTAIATAQRAHHQRIAAEAWNHLVFLVGSHRARPEEVLRWLPVAESAVRITASPGLEAAYEGNVGAVYFELQDYEKAAVHYKRALSLVESLRGPESLSVVNYLNNVGTVNAVRGDLESALPYFERALEIRTKRLGEDHVSVAHVLNNLSIVHSDLKNPEQALEFQQRALAIRERALPANHADVASSLNNLGALYYEAERYAEARPMFERALAIQREIFEATHPEVARTHGNLAMALGQLELYPEALSHARSAVGARRARAQQDPRALADALENLAQLQLWAEDFEGGLRAVEEVLTIRRAEGVESDRIVGALRLLADAHVGLGDPQRARAELQDGLQLPGLTEEMAGLLREDLQALE